MESWLLVLPAKLLHRISITVRGAMLYLPKQNEMKKASTGKIANRAVIDDSLPDRFEKNFIMNFDVP